MQKYRRVTYEDRCHISALLQAEYSVADIADRLGFHKTTIYREFKRNSINKTYSVERATKLSAKRYKRCRKKKKIDQSLKEEIRSYLSFGWSPEQISGRFRLEKRPPISFQTIYRSISREKIEYKYLRRSGRRGAGRHRQRKAKSKNKTFIDQRPAVTERRGRIGDWERDGMYGAHRKQLLIFTERKSRFTKIRKMRFRDSCSVKDLTKEVLGSLNRKVFSVTNDNGSEFSDNTNLPFKVYHCHPYKPNQRGTVENTIGLIRQYIKRKTDLDKLAEADLVEIERRINFRPKKCLDFETPFEVFYNKKVALVM